MSMGHLSWGSIVLGGNCPGAVFLGENCTRGNCPKWELSGGLIVLGGNCLGAIVQGELSCSHKYIWNSENNSINYNIQWKIVDKIYDNANSTMCKLCLTKNIS